MSGWIKLHRALLDWEWYHDTNTMRLFVHLLLKANHKPKKWKGMKIDRGQLVTGRMTLSDETGLSQQAIRTCLKRLEDTGEISRKTTNRFTILTIEKYSIFQGDEENATNKQPTDNQQTTTTKECKKEISLYRPPELNASAWDEYLAYRREAKLKKLTVSGEKKAINNLIGMGDDSIQQQVINQTISNGWTGLFELKRNNNGTHQQDTRSRAKRVSDELDRIAREDIEKNGFTQFLD